MDGLTTGAHTTARWNVSNKKTGSVYAVEEGTVLSLELGLMAPSRPEMFGNELVSNKREYGQGQNRTADTSILSSLGRGRLAAVFRLARVEARLPVIVVQADCCLPGKLVDLSLKLSKPSIDENKTNPGDHRG